MPGTLFLDALRKKEALQKGYPTPQGVKSEQEMSDSGLNADPMWSLGQPIKRAIERLQGSAAKAVSNEGPAVSPYETVRDRLDTEQSEGINRNKPGVTKVALPKRKRY